MNHELNDPTPDINPATGLPMIDDTYIDVGGNTYGTDMHDWQPPCDPEPDYYFPPHQDFGSW
jgi:hypothetical protein